MSAAEKLTLGPQPGPQAMFLASLADLAIYGGAAGGGKSYALLLEPLRHHKNPEFGAVIFRRNSTQVRNLGGLWDESTKIYPLFNGYPREFALEWKFPSGSRVEFAHLEYERSVHDWHGSQIPLIGFDELTHFCLTPDHEVLTSEGWQKIDQVKLGDSVASLSPDREIQFKRVLDTPKFEYSGLLMSAFQRNGVSFRATPNHEMVICRQDEKRSLGKKRLDKWGNDRIERTGLWHGTPLPDFEFQNPTGRGHGRNGNNANASIPAVDWLRFLGWYLSEGCAFRLNGGKKSAVVCIRQTKETGKVKVRKMLASLPWRYKESCDGQFRIFSTQLYNVLKPLGNTYTKRIPGYVKKASKEQIEAFWEGFVDGDGHRTKKGGIQIGLANELLIDDLQEIAFKLGLIATKGWGIGTTGFSYWQLSVSKPSRSACLVRNRNLKSEPYFGDVHCLTVEDNHNFLIRHQGRVCWSGNSERMFFYMLSRNRSTSGVPGYVRATCNPDCDSWVRQFINWWIDSDGYADPKRAGKLRYFVRIDEKIIWADTALELITRYGAESRPKSVTFIPSTIYDNKILLAKDPGYLANLRSLSRVDRERLLGDKVRGGNWNVRATAGSVFRREWFPVVDAIPAGWRKAIRFWDRAASKPTPENPSPDWTRGLLLYTYPNGTFVVADLKSLQDTPGQVETFIKNVAGQDGPTVSIWSQQDPGSAGVAEAMYFTRMLSGYDVRTVVYNKDKLTRAKPVSAQAEAGNVRVLSAPWNSDFFSELENFPDGKHDDIVDVLSGAFNQSAGIGHSILDVM